VATAIVCANFFIDKIVEISTPQIKLNLNLFVLNGGPELKSSKNKIEVLHELRNADTNVYLP
jgi:hypothetical protein